MQALQWTKHPPRALVLISPRTPPRGRAWGRGGGHRAGAVAGAGASHATCRWPKTRSGGRDMPLRLGWAETCNTYTFR